MSECYILSLPTDVLKKIPTGYRMWTLLQITCTTLNMQLGDYHIARDRHYIDSNFTEMSYDEFVERLIEHMWDDRLDPNILCISTGCTQSIDEEGKCRIRPVCTVIEWYHDQLSAHQDGCILQVLRQCLDYPSSYIEVGENRYVPSEGPWPMGPFYRVIYNELPGLYRLMTKVEYLSLKDTE